MDTRERRVALVTGSSSGIGEAIVRRLATAGFEVVVNSRSSTAAGEALAAEVGGTYIQADVSDEGAAKTLVASVLDRHHRLDVLVNNAGTTVKIPHADLDSATAEVWRNLYETNVIGPWTVTVAAVDALRSSGSGCVINMGSLAGIRPIGSSIPYASSKAALHHQTRLLAATLGPAIRVNAVAPGMIETPWTAGWDAERGAITAMSPLQRTGLPDDVAEVVVGLIASTYVTGQVVVVDGGMHLR